MTVEAPIFKEEFAKFIEDPTRERLRDAFKGHAGEFQYLDFKEVWRECPTLARHLLGLGNSDGGCIVIGVAEKENGSLDPKGIEKLIDKKKIFDGIEKYIPQKMMRNNIVILDYSFEETEYARIKGKMFQVILTKVNPEDIPLISMAGYQGKIRENAIYIRRSSSTEEANYDELQEIINKRLGTGRSSQPEMDLRTHLKELKTLLEEKDQIVFGSLFAANSLSRMMGGTADSEYLL